MNQKEETINNQKYGILVIGPSGSGKTTFISKISEIYTNFNIGVTNVNMDPGNLNDNLKVDINICDLITVEDAE